VGCGSKLYQYEENSESEEDACEKAGHGAQGYDRGVGCGSYFPGDGFADDGKREDANNAYGAEDCYDVGKRDAFGHGDVGDGNVEGHGNWKESSDESNK
jgi:hypothetical protein